MREGLSINYNTMDLYQITNYAKMTELSIIAMFCMIIIDSLLG